MVKETPKFTASMGEKPEKVVGFILEIWASYSFSTEGGPDGRDAGV